MLLVTIILIILLSLALIKVIAKGKFFDCKIKTVEQFHDAIWNNAHEFIFLIDQTSHVVRTKYYALYQLPVNNDRNYCTLYKQPVNKDRTCFGEILQC
mgnify:CR=1 FL=1